MTEELLYQGKWISIHSKSITTRNGTEAKWEFVRRSKENPEGDGVDIIAKYKDSLILVAVYRYPISRTVLEFPAGLSENLPVPQVALKELKEETGYTANESHIREISPILHSDPWKSTETIRYVLIDVPETEENEHPEQDLEDEEVITVELVSLNNLLENILALAELKGYSLDSRLYLFAKGIQDTLND